MKYIKVFEDHNDYTTYRNDADFLTPNVSVCVEEEEIHFNPYVHDYAKDYLTFEALEDCVFTIYFQGGDSGGGTYLTSAERTSYSYSLDNGNTWETTTFTGNIGIGVKVTTPTIHAGEKVLWKGIGTTNCKNGPVFAYSSFASTGNFNAYGNIMSIFNGDDFVNQTTFPTNSYYTMTHLFYLNSKIIDAHNMIMPVTTLAPYWYFRMFKDCTGLTAAPSILPATTLAEGCYSEMFYNCTSLTTAPELTATTMANYCCNYMFYGCTSLTTAPELPATTLAQNCYQYMFQGCTSLTTVPELPATTLASECYKNMFSGCTSLTIAQSILPATTLVSTCYNYMFQGCTSLTTAPELPATTLASTCYSYMFKGCTNLNYIKAMFTTTPSITYTYDWVDGVAATGTFVKNSAANWDVSGRNGVPSGWTIQTASE